MSNAIGADGATAIAGALKVNSTLTSLNLDGNAIGADGTTAIAEAIKVNSTLASLNLTNNAIGAGGTTAIAGALKVNSTLTRLDLTSNTIGAGGATAIAQTLTINSTLTSLDLKNNGLGEGDFAAIAEALKVNATLTSLNLRYNESVDNPIAPTLLENISILIKRNKDIAESQIPLQERCLRVLSRTVVASYSEEEKTRVYHQIGIHSKRPNELGFGERNVFNVPWQTFLKAVHDARLDLHAGVEMLLTEKGVPLWPVCKRTFTIL